MICQLRANAQRVYFVRQLTCLLLGLFSLGLVACTPTAAPAVLSTDAATSELPTLDDFWEGTAQFEVEVADTGLPMGESDTVILADGTWRSYVHASHPSLGVLDQCGAPVEFPGCLIIFTSGDAGKSFTPTVNTAGVPICQIECARCPCDSRRDHIDQQQYPRVAWMPSNSAADNGALAGWVLTYEYRANTIVRRSTDGINWSSPAEVPLTGIWRDWLMPCHPESVIGEHPFTPMNYNCLVGSPPGIYVDQTAVPPQLYLFVGLGQNPSGMGCYRGPLHGPTSLLRACDHNPLFVGAQGYGPQESRENASANTTANAYFDFRTISSADLITVGERHYLFYEGVRGPRAGDQGDTQFLLGLARSTTLEIDGAWELFAGNPLFIDLPGNVGVGHADVVIDAGVTYLYTTLDGSQRSRMRLVWE